jgi:hypothetical protein
LTLAFASTAAAKPLLALAKVGKVALGKRVLVSRLEPRPVRVASNERVVLTCQLPVCSRSCFRSGRPVVIEMRETCDPCDRAHDERDFEGFFLPAGVSAWRRSNSGEVHRCARANPRVRAAVPRRYPASQMLSSGIAVDSAFDWLYLAQRRLAGIPGVGVRSLDEQDCGAWVDRFRFPDLKRVVRRAL